jgi:hypothetical protein
LWWKRLCPRPQAKVKDARAPAFSCGQTTDRSVLRNDESGRAPTPGGRVQPSIAAAAGVAAVIVAETLDRKLKPGTVAQVVRRPAAAYGGRSLLELFADGKHEQARQLVTGSFDWALSA